MTTLHPPDRSMTNVIEHPTPLQTNYLPQEFVDRNEELAALQSTYSNVTETSSRNLHLYGPRGTGKTHLTHTILEELPDQVNTCYIPCNQYDTQYKALKQVYQTVTKDEINDGHHTSDLQREIEQRTGAIQTVIVLDEIDFLLVNDGDSLLYYLSRIKNSENLSILTISSNHEELPIEERTQSSLQPQKISFTPYTGENTYQILRQRAQDSLRPKSLHREALTYIASTTSNLKLALHWLRTSAEKTYDTITEHLIQDLRQPGYQSYTDNLLQPFTEHHRLLYQAIEELTEEQQKDAIQSGSIYKRYQELCQTYSEETLSTRRISDYLKQLELLNLIEAEYHYGGQKGKTRDIKLNRDSQEL